MANNDITTKILDIQVRYKDAVDKLASYRKAVADAQEEQKKLKKMLKDHEIQQEEYDRKMETSRLFIIQQNAAISTLTRQIQNQMKAEQESLGSLVQWRAELSLMTAEYDRMSQSERESAAGTELRDKISDLTLQIKEAEYGTQRFQRNVGNYPDVMAPAVAASAELTEILNKQAENAEEAQRQNEALKKALDELDANAEGASDAIKAFNDKIEQNNQLIEENNRLLEESNQRSSDLLDSMGQLLGININLGKSLQSLSENNSGNFLDGLNVKAKALWKTLVGLVANPYILAVLGIAGVGMAFKWWYDYNKGIEEATRQTKDLTGLGGNELKAYRNEVQAIADTFGKDFNEVLISANALSKKMGVSAQEALVLIKDGFLAGGDANSRFLEVMKEYPAYFKEAGVSASQFVAITTQANKSGTVALKAIDSIKEANNRLRTMSSATSEALDALGLNSKKLSKAIEDGSMSTFEAMQQVSSKLAELPANSQTVAEAVSNIFGSAGTDAGLQYLTTLKDIELNLDKVKDEAGEMAKLQEEQLQSQMELQNALAGLFDATGGTFESLTTKARTFVNKGLTWVIKGVVDLCNWFIEFYNESVLVRGMVLAIGNSFKNTWAVIKAACGYIWDVIAGLGTMIKGAFTLNWDEFKSGWDRAAKALVKNMSSMVNEAIDNTVDAWNNLDKRLDKIEMPAEVTVDDSSIPTADDSQKTNKKGGKKKDKSGKTAGKTPQEEEKELLRKAEDELYKIASDAFETRRKQIASEYDREIAMLRDKLERDKTLSAEQQAEINSQILALIQQKNDAILAAEKEILNGEMSVYEAKRLQASIQYDRQIEDYRKKLETDKTLTGKSRQAINSIILSLEKQKEEALEKLAQEELKKEIEYRSKMIELQLAAVKEGSEEEFRLKQEQLLAQREMDLANTELTEEQRLAIIAKYNKMGEDLEKEHQLSVWTKQQEAMKTRFSNALDLQSSHDQERLAQMEMAGASETMLSLQQQYDKHEQERTQLAQMQEELSTMRREDNETQTQFEERQAVKRQQIATQETQIKLTQYQLQKTTMTTLTSAIDAMGEHSKAFATASKVIALAEIAINTGKALAAGISQAQSVPFPANLAAIATTVATILANVATAISTVKSAKFATGGKVEGPGNGTSDSIPAMLSNGEYVINAESTAKYEPLLEAINKNRVSVTTESDSKYMDDLESALYGIIENERTAMRREESERYERIINTLKESRVSASEYDSEERIHEDMLNEIEKKYSAVTIVRRQNEIIERLSTLEQVYPFNLEETSPIRGHNIDAAPVYEEFTRELSTEVAKAVSVSIRTERATDLNRTSRIIAFAIEAGSVGVPGSLVALALNDMSRKSVGAKALKFAGGGKVVGPGTSTSDSIQALLSNGEYVVNAKATKLFEPLLMAMNGIGSQIPMQVANSYQTIETADMMTNSFSEAAKEIKPVVSVVEITEVQDRVSMIENLDSY